jgi:hypothetical protein
MYAAENGSTMHNFTQSLATTGAVCMSLSLLSKATFSNHCFVSESSQSKRSICPIKHVKNLLCVFLYCKLHFNPALVCFVFYILFKSPGGCNEFLLQPKKHFRILALINMADSCSWAEDFDTCSWHVPKGGEHTKPFQPIQEGQLSCSKFV